MPHEMDILVGKRIRAARKFKGITQQQLAKKVGVKFQQLQKYETAANRVSASRLFMIAEALEASPAFFLQPAEVGAARGFSIPALSPEEIDLVRASRQMTFGEKRALINLIRELIPESTV